MKKIINLLLLLCLILSGCGKKDNEETINGGAIDINPDAQGVVVREDISGDYYAISCRDTDGTELELYNDRLHLNPDGTGTYEVDGEFYNLEWKYEDKVFSFADEGGDQFTGTCYNGMIGGTYYYDYYFMFVSDYDLYLSLTQDVSTLTEDSGNASNEDMTTENASSTSVYYTLQTLREPKYGIKTALALVPYGWSASVNVLWGVCSTMYPAFATVTMTSPDGNARIEVTSTMAYMQMARNGSWVAEGTYLDFYNIFLNYRNAHEYNDYILGTMGYKGTILNQQKASYEHQLALNGEANTYLAALSASQGVSGKRCEGSFEKTSYFITQGNAYEVDISSAVIMAEIESGMFDQYLWTVPYSAAFTAYTEEAYSNYYQIFDNVVANTNFTNEFIYVVQRNAQYLNEMMHQYLMEKVYSPSSSDINSWDSEYTDNGSDKFINEWCDVITERDEYTTIDGNSIKVPTAYDTVYQDGDYIYMGPDSGAPQGWTQLNKN